MWRPLITASGSEPELLVNGGGPFLWASQDRETDSELPRKCRLRIGRPGPRLWVALWQQYRGYVVVTWLSWDLFPGERLPSRPGRMR